MNEPEALGDALLLKASLAELEQQRAAVLQLNELKNDLIAVLAHDIKGPLTSIVGFAELLEDGYLEGDAAVDAARTIRTNAQRLATLANDVLALSRIEHGELEIADQKVDLIDIVIEAIDRLMAEREIRFEASIKPAMVRGDRERLGQVFDNLLRNAVKYSTDTPIDVRVEPDADSFVTTIRDRGIGIPADEIPKLFARFSRGSNAKRSRVPGTGLGLFIVRMIVERHGGTVGVESTLDEGSTFRVTLPTFDAASKSRPMRVTIVAVDRLIRNSVAYELRSSGYRVRECTSIEDVPGMDIRDGDVVVLGPYVRTPAKLRAALPEGVRIRLVGVEHDPAECDAVITRPFLAADLLAAVSGEPREHFLSTAADTSRVPTDEPRDDSVRTP